MKNALTLTGPTLTGPTLAGTTLAGLTLAVLLSVPAAAPAVTLNQIAASEQSVQRMPLEQRPNRVGHIYGNNVRRLYHRRIFINRGRYEQPMRRFFYMP